MGSVRDWRNRHVSHVRRHPDDTWSQMAPVCHACGFTCLTALDPDDYTYILQDHYTVCLGAHMDPITGEVDFDVCSGCGQRGINPSNTRAGLQEHYDQCEPYWRKGGVNMELKVIKRWKFSERTFLRFRWNPYQPKTVWVFVPVDFYDDERTLQHWASQGKQPHDYVMLHGIAVMEHEYRKQVYDTLPTYEQAIEASKKYVKAWEACANAIGQSITCSRLRYLVGPYYSGDRNGFGVACARVRTTPDNYYLHKRTTRRPEQAIQILTSLLLGSREWAEQAWDEYTEGRTEQQVIQDVAMAYAAGTLKPYESPDNGSQDESSISNGSGNVAPEVMDIFS